MDLTKTLARIDRSAANYGDCLHPGATEKAIAAVGTKLGIPLPAALRDVYAWHDGETATSRLLLETIFMDFASLTGVPTASFRISFLPLEQVAGIGKRSLWLQGKWAFRAWD